MDDLLASHGRALAAGEDLLVERIAVVEGPTRLRGWQYAIVYVSAETPA